MSSVRVGTCGFCLRQTEYYRAFPVVEIQQTFYQPPQESTVRRWRAQAPSDFEFTLKAFQAITHPPDSPTYRRCKLSVAQRRQCGSFRDTPAVRQAWKTTRELAGVLGARIVVFQCPRSFAPTQANLANLRHFFQSADRGGLICGWEPRGPAWTDDLIQALCRELELVHVVDPFDRRPVYGTPRYYRLHGIGGYGHHYTDAELNRLLELCKGEPTYCLFNNKHMAEDARRFRCLVE